jgi:hypothetical protein
MVVFLASGGGWYSTDCREKRGKEKINPPPSIRQATQKPGACSILILFIITGNKRKHQYQQQQSYRSPSVTVYVYMYIHIYIKRR